MEPSFQPLSPHLTVRAKQPLSNTTPASYVQLSSMSPAEVSGLRVHVVLRSPASVITNIWFSNGTWISGHLDIQTVWLPASKNEDRLEPLCFDLYGDEFGYQSIRVYHRSLPQGQLRSQQLQDDELTKKNQRAQTFGLAQGSSYFSVFLKVGGLHNPGLNVWGKTLQERKGGQKASRCQEG